MNRPRPEPGRAPSRAALLLIPLYLLACASAPVPDPGPVSSRDPDPQELAGTGPRLVVFLVVDQLRGDMLDRYGPAFSGGLKRIMQKGYSFSNALHGHSATETSPGHAALSTGVHPGRAGIPSNAWREGSGREVHPVYNVVDPSEGLLGVPGLPGSSPKVLRRTGLADWIIEADPQALVVSVSGKDRAAVLMAGKAKGSVFWFNSSVGRFVTSTYYRRRNPSWLLNFNEQVLSGYRADSVWVSTIPPEMAHLSAPDTASFEGDGTHTYFPHRYYDERVDPGMDDFFLWFEGTPLLDGATLELARLALKETGAGTTPGRTDFISVSLSQTDRVGHAYGPLSREQMDNLLRLDRALGTFLDFLDEVVGPDNYILGLTGDHGVMTVPERLEVPGVRLTTSHRSGLEMALGKAVRRANRNGSSSPGSHIVEELREMTFVGPAYEREALLSGGVAQDSMANLFRNSFVEGRMGGLLSPYGVEMWWTENTVDWTLPRGTTHGSPYFYDRWVPLIVMGPDVEVGRTDQRVQPVDLAPTLAWLAGIPFPDDLDGKPLLGGR